MKRPCDQAKLFLLALLRSTAALATESSKLGTSTMSSVKIFPATAPAIASSSSSSSAAAAAASTSSTAAATLRWIQLRLARRTDVPSLQRCNLATLPENYNSQFYLNHLRTWPDLALVCEALPLHYNENDVPPSFGGSNKLTALWGGVASRPFAPEPNIVAYVLGKIEEDEDSFYDDDDDDEENVPPSNNDSTQAWIDNDDAYYAAWSKPSLLRFRNANPSHRSLSSSKSFLSRQEEEDLMQELSSSSSSRQRNAASNARPQQQQQQQQRRRRHRLRGHVTSLAVLPEYRRMGLAAALMKQLHHHLTTTTSFTLEQPPQPYYDDDDDENSYGSSWDTTKVYQNSQDHKKITRVGLHVRKSNTAACSLYQRDGYEVTRVISNYYQDGEDAFYMTKELQAAPVAEKEDEPSISPRSRQAPLASNKNKPTQQQQQQQRLWGRGSQRWRVSSPQARKEQQQQKQQQQVAARQVEKTNDDGDGFQLPRFLDLELERQEYLRNQEAAMAAAKAATSSSSKSQNGKTTPLEQVHPDSDEEPELLTGTM